MQRNIGLNVFENDSHHACSNGTVHFTQTLTELTLNLFSGGDFRRKPEIKTPPSPISTMNLFGSWGIEWRSSSTREAKTQQITPEIRFHLNNTIASQHGSHH